LQFDLSQEQKKRGKGGKGVRGYISPTPLVYEYHLIEKWRGERKKVAGYEIR